MHKHFVKLTQKNTVYFPLYLFKIVHIFIIFVQYFGFAHL